MEPTPLGVTVRCNITGYSGVVTARAEYLSSTPQLQITRANKDGTPHTEWIYESQCDIIPDVVINAGF